jgi:hypothetical protein
MNLKIWEENFLYLLNQKWINLIVGSTLTPLTIKTFPDLLEKINEWSKIRKVYHYQNAVNWPDHQFIDIFGNIFDNDFKKALELKPDNTEEETLSKNYLKGISEQSSCNAPNLLKIQQLFDFLNTMDKRRKTNWKDVFPWLVVEFAKYKLYAKTE